MPDPDDSSMNMLFALTNALQPVRRAWVQVAGSVISQVGLSNSLGTVILLLSRHGVSIPQKDLATEVGVHPAALVRTLDQGEVAGLLRRRDVPGDRRFKAVELLPEGQRLAEIIEKGLEDLRGELLGDLPIEQIDITTRILRTIEDRALAHMQQATS